MPNFSIHLTPDLHKALSEHAEQHGVSKNSVIREAIREMVVEPAPYAMREDQMPFIYEEPAEDFSKFADCKNLKEAFEKMGKKI